MKDTCILHAVLLSFCLKAITHLSYLFGYYLETMYTHQHKRLLFIVSYLHVKFTTSLMIAGRI